MRNGPHQVRIPEHRLEHPVGLLKMCANGVMTGDSWHCGCFICTVHGANLGRLDRSIDALELVLCKCRGIFCARRVFVFLVLFSA